jgi:hypothetical protein
MGEWLRVLGSIGEPELILLGLVVLAVLFLTFRLLQAVIKGTTDQTASAILVLAGELKSISKDQTRLIV